MSLHLSTESFFTLSQFSDSEETFTLSIGLKYINSPIINVQMVARMHNKVHSIITFSSLLQLAENNLKYFEHFPV